MIKSMTGYGNAKGSSGKLEISIELKSVNNRFLDCNIRLPRVYTSLEENLKAIVQKYISRGKVDVFINIDASAADDVVVSLNESIAEAYVNVFRQMSEKYGIENDLTASSLSRMPDVLRVEKAEADTEQLGNELGHVLEEAMQQFDAMRKREGEKLYNDVRSRLDTIEALGQKAEARSPVTAAEYRAKLEQRMRDVLENKELDENRILMEAAIFADKIAISEETVRLSSHISQMRQIIESDQPVGRKLDFLVQEMNREANTMGSKGNDVELARIVVDIKTEVEKIREQIQNVE